MNIAEYKEINSTTYKTTNDTFIKSTEDDTYTEVMNRFYKLQNKTTSTDEVNIN